MLGSRDSMLILSSGRTAMRNHLRQQISNNQKVAAVTIYSQMFDDSRISRHTSALPIRKWLEDADETSASEEVEQ